MRCPKCHFVAFREIEKCPSCGEVLSPPFRGRGRPFSERSRDEDSPVGGYSTVDDSVGPLADYTLRPPESFVPPPRRRHTRRARAGEPVRPRPDESAGDRPSRQRSSATDRVRSQREAAAAARGGAQERGIGHQLPRRLVGGVIDLALLSGINAAVVYFTTRLVGLPVASAADLPLAPLLAFLTIFNVGYVATLTALGGQTIGKMAVRVRVEEADGSNVTPVHAVIRTAAYLVSVLPLGLGFAVMFFKSGRALHDLLADTRVVSLS